MRKPDKRKPDKKKRDSEATRKRIITQTASLLNTDGYLRTPMSEIMRVTGLKKGGIYHHFKSREALALEAFKYSAGLVRERVMQVIGSKATAKDKLLSLIRVFRNFPLDDVLRGGCPVVNLAVESDDVNPRLCAAARQAMEGLLSRYVQVIEEGVKQGEFVKGDALARAAHLVAALEGGVILSNLYKDYIYLQHIADQLEVQVKTGLKFPSS